ncbi:MAG TPA: phytanoyl-CoA dioxygenase family protein [Terriglobales bacterium]|nr:phytanoyl-CoA dioxygenase family protein [Terriglobales bacterium]
MHWRSAVEESGFAILPEALPCERTERLLDEMAQSSPRRSRAGVRHAMRLPAVEALAQERSLIDLAREVLGPEAFPFRATLFDKSAQSNWLVVWHQDTALPLQNRLDLDGWGPWSIKDGIHYAHAPASPLSLVLALRIHLDDSNELNGPLRVLPGTHKLGVLDDDAIHALAMKVSPIDCLIRRGGVLAMRPLVVHASSKTETEDPRRVLHIEYAASPSIAAPLWLAIA